MSKKIVIVLDIMPARIGGMETHARAFMEYLRGSHQYILAAVVGFREQYSGPSSTEREGDAIIVPFDAIRDPKYLIAVLQKVTMGAGDIVFFNSLYWIRILPDLKSTFPSSLFVMRSGGNDIMQSAINDKGITLAERRHYVVETIRTYLDLLIVNSAFTYRRFKRIGLPGGLMRIAIGGVDTKEFHPVARKERARLRGKLMLPHDKMIIVMVARLVRFKGVDRLIAALSQLPVGLRSRIHCIVVGDGPERLRLESCIDRAGMRSIIELRKSVSHEDVAEYYQAADMYCQTSFRARERVRGGSYIHTETMGRSIIEALSTGLPVVCTAVGGVPEIISHGTNGVLVIHDSPKALSLALARLLTDSEVRKEMRNRAQASAQQFSWELLFDLYSHWVGV